MAFRATLRRLSDKATTKRLRLTLFTGGPECSLCEVAKEDLQRIRKSHDFDLNYWNIRDPPVDADPYDVVKWRRLYQYDIPVLHHGDRRLQKHRINEEKLVQALKALRAEAEITKTS